MTNSESGSAPARGVTIDVPAPREDETLSALRERQILLEATVRSLTGSLVQAKLDAEVARRQAASVALKLETFGLSAVDKDKTSLEQRLLAAVRLLRDLKKQGDDARVELVRLTEAVVTLVKTADRVDPAARLAVETELRKTKEILEDNNSGAFAQNYPVSLADAMVVDVKEDLGLIVANVGEKQGVRIGMPFKVLRSQKYLATVRVVDVRERICGAVIQSLNSIKNPIRQGDRLTVETQP